MTKRTGLSKPRTLAFVVVVVSVCGLVGVWAIVDASPPQDAVEQFDGGSPDGGLPPELARSVSGLSRILASTRVEGKHLGEAIRSTSPASRQSAAADELIALAAQQLRLMDTDTDARADSAIPGNLTNDEWTYVLTGVRLVAWGVERQLFAGEPESALSAAKKTLNYCLRIRAAVTSLSGFMMARSCQQLIVRTLARGIDEKRWGDEQLNAMAMLQPGAEWDAQLDRVLRTDYHTVDELAQRRQAEMPWPLSRFAYHPKRTARVWSETLAPVLMALRTHDIAGAYDAMVRQLSDLSRAPHVRNAVGLGAIASAAAAYPTLIAQTQNAALSLPLLSLRATLELKRNKQEGWPRSNVELEQMLGDRVPVDPWRQAGAHLAYGTSPTRVYSIGPNRRDDGGRFDESFSLSNVTDDYGIEVPD